MRISLVVSVALALAVGSLAAQTYTDQASATIQVTATVVPSLGVTSPDDNLLYSNAAHNPGVIDVAVNKTGTEALSMHRMLVRYPSLGSVVVSIESDSKAAESFALARWHQDEPDLSRPGAVVLDLEDIDRELTANGSDIILTLIYSEN